MRNESFQRLIVVCTMLAGMAGSAFCQSSNATESLIDEWNFANNDRNIHSFEKVYADYLVFYGNRVPRNVAIQTKQQLFRDQPAFRQRIITEISYEGHSAGVTRAGFTREVFNGVSWTKQPSYLLISKVRDRYVIVGEGDVPPPKKREPDSVVTTAESEPAADSADSSVTEVVPVLPQMEHPDSVVDDLASSPLTGADTAGTALSLPDPDVLSSGLQSGVVEVPRSYLIILVVMLALGGLMIVVADSVQSRRRRTGKTPRVHDEAEHVVRDFRVQAAFEAFVVTLFDPLFFKSFRPKAEYALAGDEGDMEAGKGPDLVIDYRQKETHVRFAISCQYYRHAVKTEVQLPSHAQQESIRRFQADLDMEVYYVLGFGGRPDDPRELFFVPCRDVLSEYITRTQLRQYSKSGMFYYNRRTGRIR